MMECRDKFMLSMYISYFFWIGHAYGHCRNLDSESIFADVESKGSSPLHPAISTVFETFFTNTELEHRCVPKKFIESKKSIRSLFTISKSNEYVGTIYSSDGTNVSFWGRFQLKEGNSYISWTGQNKASKGQASGRTYILDIQPHQTNPNQAWSETDESVTRGGNVITFYTCFEDEAKEGIFMVQAPGGTSSVREKNVATAKQTLDTLRIPTDLKNIACY